MRSVLWALALLAAEAFERIVAVVDGHAITLLDVRKAARIEVTTRLETVRGGAVATSENDPSPEVLELARLELIQEALLLQEAQKSNVPPLAEPSVDRAFADFAARFPTPEAFQQFLLRSSLDADDIRDTLRRTQRADQVIALRLASRVEITPNDVAKFRAAHPDAFSWTKARVMSEAKKEHLQIATRAYLEELCTRAEITIFGSFDQASPQPAPCSAARAVP